RWPDAERAVHRSRPDRSRTRRPARRKGADRRSRRVTEAVHNAPSALDEAVDRYLAHLRVERGLLDATLEAYARDLREYVEWLTASGIARLSEVTEPTVLQHLGALQIRGLSRASQARHLAAVRGLHKFANAEGLAPSDPSEGVEATRGSRPLPRFLGIEDVDRLLSQPDGTTVPGARDKAMLEVLY